MPNFYFADLVRETSHATGTGALVLAGAVPGHRRFADIVPPGAIFHYAIVGVTHADQWETGTGALDAQGRLDRSAVAASSAGGGWVDFGPGLKTVALTVGSGWFAGQDSAVAALAADLAAKQPLSTLHPLTTNANAGDRVAARRGAGWVNLPIEALAWRGDDGRFRLAGPIDLTNGSAATPALAVAGDGDTGLFSPAANTIALSTGASERLRVTDTGRVGIGTATPSVNVEITAADPQFRIRQTASNATPFGLEIGAGGFVDAAFKSLLTTGEVRITAGRNSSWGGHLTFHTDTVERLRVAANGNVGVGTAAPATQLHVHSPLSEAFRISTAAARGTGNLFQSWHDAAGRKGYIGYGASDDSFFINNEMDTPVFIWTGGAARLVITSAGTWAGADNVAALGASSVRWSVVYAATGTINTSDAREKTWRGGLNAAELRAASRIAREIGVFQWNDAIAEKGADGARLHVGLRAQAVWAIMAEEGLVDPIGRTGKPGAAPYAFLCWDSWSDGKGGRKRDRFGVRPDQLTLFIAAAQEARLTALEAHCRGAA